MGYPVIFVDTYLALLFPGLFLGDGKQSIINIYGAATSLVLWVLYLLTGPRASLKRLPRLISWSWAVVAAAIIASAWFSDSVGLSVSWTVRMIGAYLVYRLFFELATQKTAQALLSGIGIFVSLSAGLYVVSLLFPAFSLSLPLVSLITIRYGHSHLADLLVFVLPMLAHGIPSPIRRARWVGYAAWSVFVATALLTLSRGVWILGGVYVLYRSFGARGRYAWRILNVLGISAIIVLLFGFPRGMMNVRYGPAFSRITERKYPVTIRLEYWRQAAVAFRERPIFGSGPGTFPLQSTRLQSSINSSSWFVHNEPLQIASEMGAVGVAAFAFLAYAHILALWRRRSTLRTDPLRAVLAETLVLVFLYSGFEFVLDYLIVWMLFWAMLGTLLGMTTGSGEV